MEELKKCTLCPKKCKVDRYKTVGFCKANHRLKIALANLHMWEEPCISGENGSGTIFFSYCNLGCIYCQNYSIRDGYGKYISIKRLSEICLELQEKKAHNINLVTPTQYVPHIIRAIRKAKKSGLNIPIVYNTSGYENVETIKMLDGTVDIYLTDFKYFNANCSKKYSYVSDYFEVAKLALEEMVNQIGDAKFKDDMMTRGIIVRVLLLPGRVEDAKKIVEYLYNTYGDSIYISLMNQYTPVKKYKYEELNNKVTKKEYEELIDYAYDLGVRNAFVQEDGTDSLSFIPNFNKEGV